jgi:hypothetical protein
MAGRLRLAVTGVQDQWLTGDPKISYFSSIYKRHTRFSTEAVGIPITGNVSLGGNAIARIPNNVGDLLRSVMLKLTLGELPSGNLYNASVATSVIQYVDLVIGGQTIQRLTGDYIDMYNQLHSNKDDADTTLYYMNGHNNQIQIVSAPRTFYLNLPFYFFRNPSLAIPICAITRQLIEIHIKFKDVDDDVTFSYEEVNGNMVRTKTELGSIVEAAIITDFYFITRDEINFLLTRPMQYIITQLQLSTMQFKPNESEKSALLKFTNPVKELFFLAKEETGTTNVTESTYTIPQPVATIEYAQESVISNNGLVAVIANTDAGFGSGQVKIFEKDSSGNWPSTPSATYGGSYTGEALGQVLGVSDDGTRVAMQTSTKMVVVEKSVTTTTTYTVTVASVDGGNRYHIDGVDRAPLTFYRGNTYIFDLSDASNANHPLGFYPTFNTGVVDNYGTNPPGTTGSQVTFTVPTGAPSNISYLCQTHGAGMGSTITVSDLGWAQIGSDITTPFNTITGSCLTGDGTKVFGTSSVPDPSSADWSQVGQDIDGEAADDEFGQSVSMSADGTRMVVGAEKNDGSGDRSGHVRVYDWDSGTSLWTQVGQDIDGEAAGDRSGWSVSISSDGTRVAIGATGNDGTAAAAGHVRVYEVVLSYGVLVWTQVGSDIDGEAGADRFGYSVSISSDGTRVVIGAILNDGVTGAIYNAGHARVYEESGGTWTQIGSDIDGDVANDYTGRSVSISSDGTRVAIGAPTQDSGRVRVYEDIGGTWTQVGADIDGEAVYDQSGHSVSISSDGTRVAIGAYGNDDIGNYAGHVRVYEWDTPAFPSQWTQVGQDIDGEAANDEFGRSVSISSDGTRVAIGAHDNDGNGSDAGHVRVYDWNSGTSLWTQVGQDIDGEAAGDESGYSVSISSDGTRVAIGAPFNDGTGSNAGHVRVYSLSTPTIPKVSSWEYSGSSWSQYRPDITVNTAISRISHSTNGEILGLEDATKTVIYATTGSVSTYTRRHTDTQYSERYHSLSSDGANLVSLGNLGSKVWNGTNYVYDGVGGTQVPWYTTSASSMVEISRNGSLVFWNDYSSNRFKLYSKSVVDGNVQWTLESSEEYFYTPVKMSALGSDAIIVSGSGSAGAKIYDITVSPGAGEDRLLNISSSDQAFSSHVTNKRSDYRFVKNIRFECNGKRMFDHTGKYLAYEQSLIHHTGCPDPAYEFYTYSFALKPELYYPTGQLNMSRIIHKKLDVELDETSTSRNINFSIYALNYNLLHVEGGLAGLKF